MRAVVPLPEPFSSWLTARGWRLRGHQAALLAQARDGKSALLVAPTGAGKTLAGFLPSLVELAADPAPGLHTLYVSPLKALAIDVHRNVEKPIAEMALPIRAETRTGDTPQAKRVRQRKSPPHILMTTPESLALMLSYPDARAFFGRLRAVVIDEVHALAGTKRGDLLALDLARLAEVAPDARRIGLSATVAEPPSLARFLASGQDANPAIVQGEAGARAAVSILVPEARIPWSGHMAVHALPEVYRAIAKARSAIVFVNTRAQAEICFRELWKLNEANLAIALHHGSLAPEQRRKVEAAMAAGKLRAVVATSSLDLGIDWGDVDLVVQIGAPKGAARLIQRVGRANHRLDEASRAVLVPANRFEMLECRAAIAALDAAEIEPLRAPPGALDVLAQHLLANACSEPFDADATFARVRGAAPYENLARADFERVLGFVADGGYALGAYERFKRLKRDEAGKWTVSSALAVRQYRLNVGTIVEEPMLNVAFRRGKRLGRIEENFIVHLAPGDTFAFAGQVLRYEGMRETTVEVSRAKDDQPKVPIFAGGRMPFTAELAARVRGILNDPESWKDLPRDVKEWLTLQRRRSELPSRDGLLVETFPRHGRWFLVAYCFAGRNAHQTLGMLLTRRMERAGLRPLGFVASDYSIAVWSTRPVDRPEELLVEDILGDELEEWLADSAMLKRAFRNVAVIAGLIERRHPGQEKTGRQVTFSSDLIYDVLRKHEPDHVLLRATRADAATGLVDLERLAAVLRAARGKIRHRRLARVSPLAVPVLLEVGREAVYGAAIEDALADEAAAQALIDEATHEDPQGELL
ncbi:MAG: ligase-associated DNA damage response DEXH box helicase [Tagaea sp.]